jgi:hypothetical protein
MTSLTTSGMGDVTALAPGVDEQTAIHAPAAEPSSPIAYSEALEVPDEPRRWHAPATLFLIAVLALIAASAGWFLIRPHVMPARSVPHPPALTAVKAAPIAAPTPPPTPPAPVPSAGLVDELAAADSADVQTAAPPAPKLQVIVLPPTAAVNDIFLRQLSVFGIVIENRDEAISGAQRVCAALGQGVPPAAIVPDVIAGSDHITTLQAEGFIATAVNVYCPQFRR